MLANNSFIADTRPKHCFTVKSLIEASSHRSVTYSGDKQSERTIVAWAGLSLVSRHRTSGFVLSQRQRGTIDGTKDRKVKPDFAQFGFVHQENLIMACIGGSQRTAQNWARPTIPTGTDSTFRHRPNFLGSTARSISFSRPEANSEATGH